jgi:hypothetical protein
MDWVGAAAIRLPHRHQADWRREIGPEAAWAAAPPRMARELMGAASGKMAIHFLPAALLADWPPAGWLPELS